MYWLVVVLGSMSVIMICLGKCLHQDTPIADYVSGYESVAYVSSYVSISEGADAYINGLHKRLTPVAAEMLKLISTQLFHPGSCRCLHNFWKYLRSLF